MSRLLAVAGTAVALLAACGQPGRYAQWKTLADDAGRYTIRYLDPPWERVDGAGAGALLRVPNNAAAFAGIDSSLSPKYELEIAVASGAPASLAAAESTSARARGEEIVTPVREIVTHSGDAGFELATRETTGELRFKRWAWVSGEAGTIVRLALTSVPDSNELEVDALFASLDVDPGTP